METPTISASTYGCTTLVPTMDFRGVGVLGQPANLANVLVGPSPTFTQNSGPSDSPKKETTMARRLVRVIIADTHSSVPLDKVIIYNGPEKFTDATDQELFFEIPIQELLKTHNEMRVKLTENPNKAENPVFLSPARIRDLRMNVITIASF